MLKEYEKSFKTVMMRFRYQAVNISVNFAFLFYIYELYLSNFFFKQKYEIQQSKLEMQRNYEILLEEQRVTKIFQYFIKNVSHVQFF